MPDTHNWNAQDYARNASAQWGWAQELIDKLHLRGDETLLDLGSGDGRITASLAERLPRGRVTGIDASANMVALAQANFPAAQHPNLSFIQMDAAVLELSERFDAAFSNATLHWVSDHPAVLRGLSRCLKPGGHILFQMGGQGNAAEIEAAFRRRMSAPRYHKYFTEFTIPYHFYGPESYQDWLPQAGFTARRIELIPKDMQHDGPEGLRGWLRTTWFPFTDRLPDELRADFLEEVLADYLERFPLDAQCKTHVAMVRLEVEANFLS
jgi:trans-aconitate 2-methyltransferase